MIRFVAAIYTHLNRAHYRLVFATSLMLLTASLMTGCGSDQNDTDPNTSKNSPSAQTKVINKEGNYITANPNPVPGGGLTGKTTITWGTKGIPGLDVHIFIFDSSGKEAGMFATGSVGSQDAPWISQPTEFRLYQGTGPDRKLLDSVVVTRQP